MPKNVVKAVVTDLDNTLYAWVDYIVPSLEGMVASLVATTGLPRVRIVQSLKAVYERYSSNEYPFAIQESELFKPYEADFDSFNALVVEPARRAFVAAREKTLRPYPGVRETLEALRARGVLVVGLTDAPRNAAELRLKWLKLDGHFDALYTLPGYPVPERVDPEIRRREQAGHYRSRTPVVELPHEAEKPSPAGLRRVLADFRLRPDEVAYVGDNVKKDMPVAKACGVLGIWAEYGTYVSAEYRERLQVISASSVTKRHVAEETPARWPLAISSFTQVLEVLDGWRWQAPASSAAARVRPVRRAARRGRR
ncbi:MAG TPA: HAD family hydrolase [Anaeromyxobacteraceae bacterium]|nr:HAD family hydrolase [Anaeromyxobacteraceae bacterium]